MKTISVIVPVYNVERYLPECLDSILSQDYSSLEILLVDDGSTDTSGAICDDYARRDSRIRAIHQQNAGAGAAKNTGLRAATGEYLAFVDSDDTLLPGAYSYMVSLLEENGADVVQCMHQNVFPDAVEPMIVMPGRERFSVLDYMMLFPFDWTCALLWNKIYRRELFDGVFFEEGNVIDDEYFTYRGVMNAKTVIRDERVVYNYRQRRSSTMNNPLSQTKILCDRVDYQNKRRLVLGRRFPQQRRYFDLNYLEALVRLSQLPYNTNESIRMIKDHLKDYFRHGDFSIPGVRLIPALLKLSVMDIPWHLSRCEKPDAVSEQREYFS